MLTHFLIGMQFFKRKTRVVISFSCGFVSLWFYAVLLLFMLQMFFVFQSRKKKFIEKQHEWITATTISKNHNSDISLIRISLYSEHFSIPNISPLRTFLHSEHLSILNISLLHHWKIYFEIRRNISWILVLLIAFIPLIQIFHRLNLIEKGKGKLSRT